MDYKMLGGALLIVAVAISAFMEWVKLLAKKNRKELPTWVQIAIPALLSVVLSWVVWSALELPGAIQIIALYALVVFLGQYYLSMEVLKRVGFVKHTDCTQFKKEVFITVAQFRLRRIVSTYEKHHAA